MVEDLPAFGENGSRIQSEDFPPVRHEKELKKPMPDQGVILADPEDTRIHIFSRDTSVSDLFHKIKIPHNVFALLGFCPNILNPGLGLDVVGRGLVKMKTGGFPPLVTEPGLLKQLVSKAGSLGFCYSQRPGRNWESVR